MKTILDSTALFHLNYHYNKMKDVLNKNAVQETVITRINYLEILAGAAENAKVEVKKYLQQFPILEFDKTAVAVANKLAMQHRVSKANQKDFFIAAIAISNRLPVLTANGKDFSFTGLKLLPYAISTWF